MQRLFERAHPDDVFATFCSPAAPVRRWGELRLQVARVAGELSERGVRGRVGLECADRYWFTVGLLAAWQAGCSVGLRALDGSARRREAFVLSDGRLMHGDSRTFKIDEGERASCHAPSSSLRALDPERTLVVLHTSGSSGEAEAWAKNTRQLLGEAGVLAELFAVNGRDRFMASIPVEHLYGLLFGVLVPLLAGASVVRDPPRSAGALQAALDSSSASVWVSVPAQLRALTGGPLPRLRQVFSSGAPLECSAALALETPLAAPVIDVFGSTETGGIAWRRASLAETWRLLPGVSISSGNGQRLQVRSPFSADPDQPQLTADRVELAGDGFRHLGRVDAIVKVGGKRVSLMEIERRACDLAGVRAARALVWPSQRLRHDELWLVVETDAWTAHELATELAKVLPAVSLPRRIRVVSELPRSAAGKVGRVALAQLFAVGAAAAASRAGAAAAKEAEQ